MFEYFEHTADIGIRLRSDSLDGLFADAGRALFALLVENPGQVQPRLTTQVSLAAPTLEDLLYDWLSELLYHFDARHLVLCEFSVAVAGTALRASLGGEAIDPARHQLGREVKAVTYHELSVRQTADGFEATVILDL